jgi:Uma2 family endonuclease
MPPCGEEQSSVAAAISWILIDWARRTPGFDVGGNEAGVILDGEVRGLDGGVWARTSRKRTNGFRRTAPLLAVEVQGEDETAESLRRKAQWYLAHGVVTVWLVFPETSAVVVVTADGEKRCRDRLPEPRGLAGLSPAVADVFWRSK